MAPMKLYGVPLSSNVIRVASALNEKGLDYELVPVDLRNGAQRQPDFLALNPFGKVPVLQDGEEILFESRAINRYIATKYKSDGPDLLPVPRVAASTSTRRRRTWCTSSSSSPCAARVPPTPPSWTSRRRRCARCLTCTRSGCPGASTLPATRSPSPTSTTWPNCSTSPRAPRRTSCSRPGRT